MIDKLKSAKQTSICHVIIKLDMGAHNHCALSHVLRSLYTVHTNGSFSGPRGNMNFTKGITGKNDVCINS